MSFSKTLSSIETAEDQLLEMATALEKEPSNGRVGAIRALLDSKWKRMDKLLPALKATELTGTDGGDIPMSLQVIFGNQAPPKA